MKAKAALIAALFLVQSDVAFAQTNQLDRSDFYLETCGDVRLELEVVCNAYVRGYLDTLNIYNATYKLIVNKLGTDELDKEETLLLSDFTKRRLEACIPENVSMEQLNRVWMKYLKDHPEDHHKPPTITLASSFLEAFPC